MLGSGLPVAASPITIFSGQLWMILSQGHFGAIMYSRSGYLYVGGIKAPFLYKYPREIR
jgi:hypothetical protein